MNWNQIIQDTPAVLTTAGIIGTPIYRKIKAVLDHLERQDNHLARQDQDLQETLRKINGHLKEFQSHVDTDNENFDKVRRGQEELKDIIAKLPCGPIYKKSSSKMSVKKIEDS